MQQSLADQKSFGQSAMVGEESERAVSCRDCASDHTATNDLVSPRPARPLVEVRSREKQLAL